MVLDDPMGLPPAADEAALAATEFQETARDELQEAATSIVERVAGLDWYDLKIFQCGIQHTELGLKGIDLSVMIRGKRIKLKNLGTQSAGLARRLAKRAGLRWPLERDPRTGRIKGGGPKKGMADLTAALRAAKPVWALADAVARYPGCGEPRTLLRLLNALREVYGKGGAKSFRTELAQAAGLGNPKATRLLYYGLLPRTRGPAVGLTPEQARQVQKALVKAREKIREEARKNGLFGGPGPDGGLDMGFGAGLPPLPDLPPLPEVPAAEAEDDL